MSAISEIKELLKSDKLSGFTATPEGHHGGKYVRRLEDCVREYFNVDYCLVFNSATSALHASCIACGIEGFEAICSPFSFSASSSCVKMAGGEVRYADIEDKTFCINPEEINVTRDTRAIIPVHLCGNMADMDAIMEIADKHNLYVIEDAAQAIGATSKGRYAGTIGHCGVFSFNQSKQISCGEGGVLITNNKRIAVEASLVRNHGECVFPEFRTLGYNYRMTEIEAIIAYHRFKKIETVLEHRRKNAELLTSLLDGVDVSTPFLLPEIEHAWYTYPIKVKDNQYVAREMTRRGLPLRPGYITRPLNTLDIYDYQPCPVTERMWSNELIITDIIKQPKGIVMDFAENLRDLV